MALALAVGCSPSSDPPATAASGKALPKGFTPTPEQHAMPKSLLVVKRTEITKARFPAIDFHFHGRTLETAEDYEALVRLMDQAGVGAIANMDGGMYDVLDTNLRIGYSYKQRIVQFARPVWEGINDPGWSEKTAAELERAFKAGAQGLKIDKALGLELKNADGTYILPDDPRMDPIWAMCAKYAKPVMIHVSDPIARWDPIGPTTSGTRLACGAPTPTATTTRPASRTTRRSGNTRKRCSASTPTRASCSRTSPTCRRTSSAPAGSSTRSRTPTSNSPPGTDDLGRQPFSARKWLIKYQDRVLFGTDGSPGRELDQFWTPHWRFAETDDEYFDHPAQMLSKLGAPLQGRWRIYGVALPDDVLRKMYYANALKYLPSLRASIDTQLAGRNAPQAPTQPTR